MTGFIIGAGVVMIIAHMVHAHDAIVASRQIKQLNGRIASLEQQLRPMSREAYEASLQQPTSDVSDYTTWG